VLLVFCRKKGKGGTRKKKRGREGSGEAAGFISNSWSFIAYFEKKEGEKKKRDGEAKKGKGRRGKKRPYFRIVAILSATEFFYRERDSGGKPQVVSGPPVPR